MNSMSRTTSVPHAQDPLCAPLRLSRRPDAVRPTILLIDEAQVRWDPLKHLLIARATDLAITDMAWTQSGAMPRPDLIAWAAPADIEAAGFCDGLARVRTHFPLAPIAILGEAEDARRAVEALRQGCRGYLPARLDPEIMAAGLRLMLAGGIFVPDCVLDGWSAGPDEAAEPCGLALTDRERDVLHRLKRGLQNKIIAFELGISQSTVKVHVRSIMRKTAATNRTEVAFLTRRMAAPRR